MGRKRHLGCLTIKISAVLEEAGKEQLTVVQWSSSTHFFSISSVEKVNIKSSILKCRLISFELE